MRNGFLFIELIRACTCACVRAPAQKHPSTIDNSVRAAAAAAISPSHNITQ